MSENNNDNAPSNRRHFSRVEYAHEVTLKTDLGESIIGAFSDISLKGMLFQGDQLPTKGANVSGTLDLGDVSMNITGVVIASAEDRGAAIRFNNLDIDSFTHLRQLLSLNLGSSETIDKEFFDSL
jgi:hypothetical protein